MYHKTEIKSNGIEIIAGSFAPYLFKICLDNELLYSRKTYTTIHIYMQQQNQQ